MTNTADTGVAAGMALTRATARCTALTRATARCGVNAASAWAYEVGRFVSHRLATDMEYMRALSMCPTPEGGGGDGGLRG